MPSSVFSRFFEKKEQEKKDVLRKDRFYRKYPSFLPIAHPAHKN
jgi:hypothetical protein